MTPQQEAARRARDNAGMIALVGLIGVLAVSRGVGAIPDAAKAAVDAVGDAAKGAGRKLHEYSLVPGQATEDARRWLFQKGFVDPFNNAVDDVGNAASKSKEFLGGFFGGDDEEDFVFIHPDTGIPVPSATPAPNVIPEDFFGEYF